MVITGIDVLVRDHTHIPVVKFDGTSIPFPDRSFDTLVFVDVLHHTNDPVLLLRDLISAVGPEIIRLNASREIRR